MIAEFFLTISKRPGWMNSLFLLTINNHNYKNTKHYECPHHVGSEVTEENRDCHFLQVTIEEAEGRLVLQTSCFSMPMPVILLAGRTQVIPATNWILATQLTLAPLASCFNYSRLGEAKCCVEHFDGSLV